MRLATLPLVAVVSLGACSAMPARNPPQDLAVADRVVTFDFTQPGQGDAAVAGDAAVPSDMNVTASDMTAPPVDATVLPDAKHLPDLIPPPDLAPPPDLLGADLGCAGVVCNTPPATQCQANSVVTYSSTGTCMMGGCVYTPMATACTYGCYNAQCTAQLSFLGNTAAYQTGTANTVNLTGGTVPSTSSVSIVTQTYPPGSAADVHLIYSLNDSTFTSPNDLLMTYDKFTNNNDQWYAIIPAQSGGTHVYWYIRADGYDGTTLYYSNFGNNFDYTSQ